MKHGFAAQVWLPAASASHYFEPVSRKSGKIAEWIAPFHGREVSPYYCGYFECFNRQLFFEAHDVLEELWLAQRTGPNDAFYKGLIQLAGAFVHLQKNRLRPAAALFGLAEVNLRKYPEVHEHLDVRNLLELIRTWKDRLENGRFEVNPLSADTAPELKLNL